MAVKRQTLNIPEQALQVLKMLERAGNKAYFVGQCVAELLRGGSPMDYDIITTADFSEMLYVFRDMRIVSQNEDMSSVMVSSLGLVIQVSSYCGEIKDGVITLKAIGEYPVVMWHENDLDENELTLKLEPKSSLVTNPFNMLTALELLGAENYEIDSVTADAIKADAPLLREADKHELSRRFTRILLTRNISGVMARFPEVFSAIEPELLKAQRYKERYYDSTLWEHISKSVEFAPPQADIRYAMLFHNVGIPDCRCRDSHGNTFFYGHGEYGRITAANFFEKYRAELKLRSDTDMLIESHDISITEDRTAVKRLLCEYSHEELKKLIKLRIADDTAKPTVHEGVIAMYRRTLTMLEDIIASGECYSISQLAIKENDLITHRLVANKAQARAVIESLYEAVLAEPSLNVAPILLDMVRKSVRR